MTSGIFRVQGGTLVPVSPTPDNPDTFVASTEPAQDGPDAQQTGWEHERGHLRTSDRLRAPGDCR
jgi:hypothetical protein